MIVFGKIFKILLFQNQHANFNQTWYKSSLEFKFVQVLLKGEIIAEIRWVDNLKIFPRNTGPEKLRCA
jgi:hypothetical protein